MATNDADVDVDDDVLPPPPAPLPPPPADFDDDEEAQEEEGTRIFGEGDAALAALKAWAATTAAAAEGGKKEQPLPPPLRHVDLRYSDAVDGASLALLGPHARGLVSLRLDGCRNVVTSVITKSAREKGDDDKDDKDAKDVGEENDVAHSAPELSAVLARSARSLRSLSLYWIPRLPSDVVYAAAAACRGLTSLNLSGCTRAVDDGALLALATSLGGGGGRESGSSGSGSGIGGVGGGIGGLRRLDLTRCQRLTDAGMARAFSLMPELRELRLYAVESFGDGAALALARCGRKEEEGIGEGGGEGKGERDDDDEEEERKSVSRLEVLDVCGARELSDAAAAELVRRRCSGSLRVLGCGWVPRVGDLLAVAVAESCASSLESLSLHGNKNLSGDAGLAALERGLSPFKRLKALDVRGCVGVSESRRTKEALRAAFGEQLTVFALQR